MKGDIQLIHGDCIDVMQDLIREGVKVDLTVTSPPYDNLRTYNGTCEWNFDIFKKVAKCLYDITADGGVVVWVVSDATYKGSETGTSFKQALYFKDIGFNLYDTMIWQKPSPQVPTEGRYYDVFEYMFIISKGKPKTLNLLKDRKNVSAGMVSNKETRSCKEDRKKKEGKRVVGEFSRRFNVWNISRGKSNTLHPAVFPEQLANDHILSWSNECDLVLDCFMGSGTTGKMALLNNRRFIGIEKVDEYFEISDKRIKESMNRKQLNLF